MKIACYKWWLLALLFVTFFLELGSRQLYNAALPQIKVDFAHLGVTDTQLGVVGTVFSAVFGLCLVASGIVADLFGRKRVIVLGTALFPLAICASGFAGGRVALLGCTRNSDFSVDYYHKVHGRGVALYGAHAWARPSCESSPGLFTHRDDAQTFLKLLSLGRLSYDGYVADVRSPADCGEVYVRLANGGAFPTTQFDWTKL